MIDNIREFKIWAEYYRLNLGIIEKDLELAKISNFKILIAMDFFDIFDYCFPFLSASFDERSEDEKREQIARHILFQNKTNIYRSPIIVLPSHLQEINEFLFSIARTARQYSDSDARINYINRIVSKYKNLSDDEIYKKISLEAPDLVLLITEGFESGMKRYENLLLSKRIDPEGSAIQNYRDETLRVNKEDFSDILELVSNARRATDRRIQDSRDAEAILYTRELNKPLNDKDRLLILVSSANHMKRLIKDNPFKVNYKEENINIIRSLDFIYVYLLELSRYIEKENIKEKIWQIAPGDLLPNVKRHSRLLNSFFEEIFPPHTTIGGILEEEISDQEFINANEVLGRLSREVPENKALKDVDQLFSEMINLNEKIEKINIARIIKSFIPKNSIRNELFKKELNNDLRTILNAGKSDQFLKFISDKSRHLERDRLINLFSIVCKSNYRIEPKLMESSFNLKSLLEACREGQLVLAEGIDKTKALDTNQMKNLIDLIKNQEEYFPEHYDVKYLNNERLILDKDNKYIYFLVRPNYEILRVDIRIIYIIMQIGTELNTEDKEVLLDLEKGKIQQIGKFYRSNVDPYLNHLLIDDDFIAAFKREYLNFMDSCHSYSTSGND